jgi:phospholipase/carboxylesterase
MSEAVVDDIVAVLPPLLQSLEALGFIARHLNPSDFDQIMEAAGRPDETLKAARPRLANWPESSPTYRCHLQPRAMRRWPRLRACARCSLARAT